MKTRQTNQIIIIVTAILVMVGVGIITISRYGSDKQATKVETNTTLVKQSSFEFQGHQYMIMEWTLGRNIGTEVSGVQLMHDPDCPCSNKK